MPKTALKLKEQEIRAWFIQTCNPANPEHRMALKRAAKMLYSRQTPDEQSSEQTRWRNGVGFNGRDSDFGSRIANWSGDLTERMAGGAKQMLRKYARQLAEITLDKR